MVRRDLDALKAFVGDDYTAARVTTKEAALVKERRIQHYDLVTGQGAFRVALGQRQT